MTTQNSTAARCYGWRHQQERAKLAPWLHAAVSAAHAADVSSNQVRSGTSTTPTIFRAQSSSVYTAAPRTNGATAALNADSHPHHGRRH